MEDRKGIAPQAGESRRQAVKKMAYAAPVVISLAVSPSFASAGSGKLSHGQPGPGKSPSRPSINN